MIRCYTSNRLFYKGANQGFCSIHFNRCSQLQYRGKVTSEIQTRIVGAEGELDDRMAITIRST